MDKDQIIERISSLEYYLENYKGMNVRFVYEWKKELEQLKDKLDEINKKSK